MSRFNLSEWALANRPLVLFAMLLVAIIGIGSYRQLSQSEDPPFTFKAMVVQTQWPGATAEQVAELVTEPIEKAMMNTGQYEMIRAYSRPGVSQVIFMAKDSMRSDQVPELFYQDEFGDTFGNIYALSGEGFDYALKRDTADRIQLQLQRIADVGKVELVGLQEERVWVELS